MYNFFVAKEKAHSKGKFGLVSRDLFRVLRAAADYSYDGLSIVDKSGVVYWVNKSYERVTSLKYEEIVGFNMMDLVKKGYYDRSVAYQVFESKQRLTINQNIKGGYRNLLVTGTPVFDKKGNVEKVICNSRDITEIVNLQKQLNLSQQKVLLYQKELSDIRSASKEAAEIIHRSQSMDKVLELAKRIAEVDSTVLITGESGTGKELIANIIGSYNKKNDLPFVKINCAALPEHLLESELFGYEKGAFTGARDTGKIGLFELANNGTLFLDEIGDMPLVLQAKLLRALQEKEIMRLGGIKPIKVNVRIVAATNLDLNKLIAQGKFRNDLYYRLMVVLIHIPALRERREDIPVLIRFFLDKYNQKFGYNKSITPGAMDKMVQYNWPGNIRELENIIERMMVTSQNDVLGENDLPESINKALLISSLPTTDNLKVKLREIEKYFLEEYYRRYGSWHVVAKHAGMDPATVYRKVNRYGLL